MPAAGARKPESHTWLRRWKSIFPDFWHLLFNPHPTRILQIVIPSLPIHVVGMVVATILVVKYLSIPFTRQVFHETSPIQDHELYNPSRSPDHPSLIWRWSGDNKVGAGPGWIINMLLESDCLLETVRNSPGRWLEYGEMVDRRRRHQFILIFNRN